jgi:hypothetical protein
MAGQEGSNILHTIKKKEGYLDCRNCLLKHVMEGNVEGREDVEEVVSRYWMT